MVLLYTYTSHPCFIESSHYALAPPVVSFLFIGRYWLFAHNRLSKEIVRGVDTSAEGEENNSIGNASELMAEPEDEDAPFKF